MMSISSWKWGSWMINYQANQDGNEMEEGHRIFGLK